MRRISQWFLVIGVLLGVGAVVLASGEDGTPTPNAPTVGRRAMNTGTQQETPVYNEDGSCVYEWGLDVEASDCPTDEATAVEAVFQPFQYGYMLWTEPDDMIYVLHHTAAQPRWISAKDAYTSGMPERDNSWSEPQPPQTTQPRLGFGVLWRENNAVRSRIGWAVQEWETVYEARVQSAADGTIYIEEPGGGVFELMPGADDWKLHSGS